MERLNAWNTYDLAMQNDCMDFARDYMDFLNVGKTERECVDFFVAEAEKNGYIELSRAIAEKRQLKAGDCVYSVWMNKSMVLFRIGDRPFEEGMNILGAHIDSPRLDVKQNRSLRTAVSAIWIRTITAVSKNTSMPLFLWPSTASS